MEPNFGTLVQTYRERAGLTQEDLANRLNVSQQTVAKWESGKAYPRPASFASLNNLLHIPLDKATAAYAVSKGARAPQNMLAPLLEKQIERFNSSVTFERNANAHQAGLHSATVAEHTRAMDEIRKLAVEMGLNGKWRSGISGGSLAWIVDYLDDKVVVQFEFAASPRALNQMIQHSVRRKLWGMATLRAHLRDHRHYSLIIFMPPTVSMDFEPGDPSQDFVPNNVVLRRLTAEAAILDLSIYIVHTATEAATLLANPDSDELWVQD